MLNCLRSTCLGTLFCLALMWPVSGVAGDYLPDFPLHVVPTPAYAMQELGVGITGPDCYYFHTPAQSPHYIDVQGQTIQYTLPLGIGVPWIGGAPMHHQRFLYPSEVTLPASIPSS